MKKRLGFINKCNVKYKKVNKKILRIINENTALPIGFVIVLFGGVTWLTSMASQVTNSSEKINYIEVKQDAISDDLTDIKEDLAAIRGRLGIPSNILRRK